MLNKPCLCTMEYHGYQLAFEAREGEWVVVWWCGGSRLKLPPLTRIWSEGGGKGGDERLECPLRLAFEAREGGWVVGDGWRLKRPPPTRVWSEGEGMGGGWWVKTKNAPSDSHLKQGRGGGDVVGWDDPSDSCLKRGRGALGDKQPPPSWQGRGWVVDKTTN